MKPVELLQEKINELIDAKAKSIVAFAMGKIGILEHEKHLTNLEPKIAEYRLAIRILKDNTE